MVVDQLLNHQSGQLLTVSSPLLIPTKSLLSSCSFSSAVFFRAWKNYLQQCTLPWSSQDLLKIFSRSSQDLLPADQWCLPPAPPASPSAQCSPPGPWTSPEQKEIKEQIETKNKKSNKNMKRINKTLKEQIEIKKSWNKTWTSPAPTLPPASPWLPPDPCKRLCLVSGQGTMMMVVAVLIATAMVLEMAIIPAYL